jgi:hypothetical protein
VRVPMPRRIAPAVLTALLVGVAPAAAGIVRAGSPSTVSLPR